MKYACGSILCVLMLSCVDVSWGIEQFYSNGTSMDGWTYIANTDDPEGAYHWTYHFFKQDESDFWWTQNIAKKYVNPKTEKYRGKILFYSEPQSLFTGFYDEDSGLYSTLDRKHRRRNLENIRPEWFPEPGDMPKLYEMGRKNCERKKADDRELAPPPTVPDVELVR